MPTENTPEDGDLDPQDGDLEGEVVDKLSEFLEENTQIESYPVKNDLLDALGIQTTNLDAAQLSEQLEILKKEELDIPASGPVRDKIDELRDIMVKFGSGSGQGDNSNWIVFKDTKSQRSALESALTPKKLLSFLRYVSKTGNPVQSSKLAKCRWASIQSLVRLVPEFADMFEVAKASFAEALHSEAVRRAVKGWDEPIIGGRNRDQVVAHVKRYDSRLMEMLLKRHDPLFKDQNEATVKISGGVLVVPGVSSSPDDWERMHNQIVAAPPPASSPGPTISTPSGAQVIDKNGD
jgi:hypothetical protein